MSRHANHAARDVDVRNPSRRLLRHPVRAWVFGLVLGAVVGAASIYLLANPPAGGVIAGTTTPGN
ncbi:hypothetical protein KX816_11275 [Sphingosinicellaceae bacterium]|nr:hypothetical protein KX816_11275 [Sphingosinicellaceae bacterium]